MIREIQSLIVSVVGGFLGRQLADEAQAWAPRLTNGLLGLAVSWLQLKDRERYSEEWSDYLLSVPGRIGPIIVCLGFLKAAYIMSFERNKFKWKLIFAWKQDVANFVPDVCQVMLNHFARGATPKEMAGITLATKKAYSLRSVLRRRYALLLDCLIPGSEDRWIKVMVSTTADIAVETKILIHAKGQMPKINLPPYH